MVLSFHEAGQALTSPDLETSFSGGVRTFSWSRLVENVCSNEHVEANWSFDARRDQLPPGWRVEAGYLVTALVGSVVTLTAKDQDALRIYEGETEIGLSQAFDGEPGRFLMFLDISFTSRGDLTEDREVVQRVFFQMGITASYKEPKTN